MFNLLLIDVVTNLLTCEQNIKEGIEGKPVDWYSDVFDLVFPDINETEVNNLWKKELAKPPKDDVAKEDSDSDLLN